MGPVDVTDRLISINNSRWSDKMTLKQDGACSCHYHDSLTRSWQSHKVMTASQEKRMGLPYSWVITAGSH